ELEASLGVDHHNRQRFEAAQRTCALRWLAVLWKQRHRREQEFTAQLDRVRQLQRQPPRPVGGPLARRSAGRVPGPATPDTRR
ncbi:MAG: hypothetical protein ACRDR6_27065, partial [Pseudonocardiaceae bacterium]